MRAIAPRFAAIAARLAEQHPKLPIELTVKALVEAYRGEGTWYSPSQLATAIPGTPVMALMQVLQLLSGAPYEILAVKWTLIGRRKNRTATDEGDDELFDVTPAAALAALNDGYLQHPMTGEEIEPKGRVHVHYEAAFPLAVDK